MNREELIKNIQSVFRLMRTIFTENTNIIRSIDSTYEKELLKDLELIPTTLLSNISSAVSIVVILLRNVNYKSALKDLVPILNAK